MKIPLAEHFHSIQGEGYWVGTPMHFVRLPGCSVGKYRTDVRTGDPQEDYLPAEDAPKLPSGKRAWICRRFDGTKFWCDTDFNKYEEVELSDLLAETWEEHICLTGGEPLMHRAVVDAFNHAMGNYLLKKLHIETSGTITPWWGVLGKKPWLTVSPKQGYKTHVVAHADELKLLVNHDGLPEPLDPVFLDHPLVYISPINPAQPAADGFTSLTDPASLDACIPILRAHPNWKLSVQLHKHLGMR